MIDLYSAASPDGHKVSIALEELGLPYTLHVLELDKGDQMAPWFLAINPNGRIPAIIDRAEDSFAVFESAAILIYLAEKTGQLMPRDMKGRSRVIQWLMFQTGGTDSMRVLDGQLKGNEYLAGAYSIADIGNWAWVRTHKWSGMTMDDLPNLQRWVEAVRARPGVQRGLMMPPSSHDLEADTGETLERFAASGASIVDTGQFQKA